MRIKLLLSTVIIILFAPSNAQDRCGGVCQAAEIDSIKNDTAFQGYAVESFGMCGEPCTNPDSKTQGTIGEWCKCCRDLSREECVAAGDNSMCAWFYNHDGCGYCMDWGGSAKCAEFNWDDSAQEHCQPTGVVDLETCHKQSTHNIDTHNIDTHNIDTHNIDMTCFICFFLFLLFSFLLWTFSS
eukprot:55820_1